MEISLSDLAATPLNRNYAIQNAEDFQMRCVAQGTAKL